MKTTNRIQLSVESASSTTTIFKENPMRRHLLTAILTSLLFTLFALSTAPAFAQETTPSGVDAADQAYLQEYHQRAVEKYQAMQATQAAKNAAIAAKAVPDWGGEMAVREYEQRAREVYAAIQKRSTPTVVNALPDWGGESFLAEYEQRVQENYRVFLASRNGRLTEVSK